MEQSQGKLLKSLEKSGVSIPSTVLSIRDMSPETLVSICAQLLNLIDETASFCSELPDSVADRFRICTDIALAVKNLGYVGDMTYYKFLYPSEEDTNRLVGFLVERLCETNEGIKASGVNYTSDGPETEKDDFKNSSDDRTKKNDNERFDEDLLRVEGVLKDLRLTSEMPLSSNSEVGDALTDGSCSVGLFSQTVDNLGIGKESNVSGTWASGNEETSSQLYDEPASELVGTSNSEDQLSKIRYEAEKLQNQEKVLFEQLKCRTSELHCLEDELELLKAAAERVLDEKQPVEFLLEQLNEQLAAKRRNLVDLERQWDDARKPQAMKKQFLEDSLYADKPEAQKKLQTLREIELEKQSISFEIRKREEDQIKLQAELERQPKMASRKSYIDRVKEITKNSGKLDAAIPRLLRDTRELQLESNSIQECLHRTYAVVEEMVVREAKKDPAVQHVFKLLTNIHGIFEQISEKILLTNRVRREVGEHEKRLAAIESRGLSVDRLQADPDAITRENDFLKKQLHDN